MATRRSPRTFQALCNATVIPLLDLEQTAGVLSLAHCTGWSADQIASKVAEVTKVVISPEVVWDCHWNWVNARNEGQNLSTTEWETMQMLLSRVGVQLAIAGRPLSETARPKTVKFAEQWCAKNGDGRPLFAGYTTDAREASKAFLLDHKSRGAFGRLTPIEERVLFVFGESMLYILKDTLKRWARAMWAKIREDPGLRPVREPEHVNLIMEFLKVFQKSHEDRYGKMESGKPSSIFGETKDNTIFIRSTGYGVKVVLGLLMADRMHIVERKRKLAREAIGFVELEAEDLECDAKDCPICQNPMGIECPDGTMEIPLCLVICCGQVMGRECLRTWLGELAYEDTYKNSCPACRFKFPDTFLQILFSEEEYSTRTAREREVVDLPNLVSPSPEPADQVRSQQEQDAQLEREIAEQAPSWEGELMNLDVDVDFDVDDAFVEPLPLPSPLDRRQMMIPSTMGYIEQYDPGQVELGELEEGEMEDDFGIEV